MWRLLAYHYYDVSKLELSYADVTLHDSILLKGQDQKSVDDFFTVPAKFQKLGEAECKIKRQTIFFSLAGVAATAGRDGVVGTQPVHRSRPLATARLWPAGADADAATWPGHQPAAALAGPAAHLALPGAGALHRSQDALGVASRRRWRRFRALLSRLMGAPPGRARSAFFFNGMPWSDWSRL